MQLVKYFVTLIFLSYWSSWILSILGSVIYLKDELEFTDILEDVSSMQ